VIVAWETEKPRHLPGLFLWTRRDRLLKADGDQYEILHNGIPRTYRDDKKLAIEAAIYAKQRCPNDQIELPRYGDR
jgi:hypothetical protein